MSAPLLIHPRAEFRRPVQLRQVDRLAAEQGRVDLGRVHRRDGQNGLADELADFLGQSAQG